MPPIGEPRLYALLAVEVEPGKIVYYHLELDHQFGACTIDLDRDTEPLDVAEYLDPTRFVARSPIHLTATLSGTVVSDRPDYRPPARADSTIGDVYALPTGDSQ